MKKYLSPNCIRLMFYENATDIWRNLSYFWHWGTFFSNFVAFSEYMNFISPNFGCLQIFFSITNIDFESLTFDSGLKTFVCNQIFFDIRMTSRELRTGKNEVLTLDISCWKNLTIKSYSFFIKTQTQFIWFRWVKIVSS